MTYNINKIKGVPPFAFLKREIEKKKISQKKFAQTLNEHPQTLNAILKNRRKISIGLALKIEKELGLEEGYISILQTYYEIAIEKQKQTNSKPDLNIITKGLFWEYDLEKIDWIRYADFIIERTFERGNTLEKEEITRFYGKQKTSSTLQKPKRKKMSLAQNIQDVIL